MLPSSFTSLYRLFLRASSAAVLHNNAARKQLRSLFRPVFDAAAQAVRELQHNQLSGPERLRHERFLETFQQRVDGTLSLLVNSAQFRGVPHRIVHNLNQLRKAHIAWVHNKYYHGSKNVWNPKAAGTNNSKAPATSPRPRDVERIERNRVHERCWDAEALDDGEATMNHAWCPDGMQSKQRS